MLHVVGCCCLTAVLLLFSLVFAVVYFLLLCVVAWRCRCSLLVVCGWWRWLLLFGVCRVSCVVRFVLLLVVTDCWLLFVVVVCRAWFGVVYVLVVGAAVCCFGVRCCLPLFAVCCRCVSLLSAVARDLCCC